MTQAYTQEHTHTQEPMQTLLWDILDMEFAMFDEVQNEGGRAGCQDNRRMFDAMRGAQFRAWDEETLRSYQKDLRDAKETGRNLLTEKYAWMMEDTAPEAFAGMKKLLPEQSPRADGLIEQIMALYMQQTEAFMDRYPAFLKRSRPVHSAGSGAVTSIETYMRGELKTYSEETLSHLLSHMETQQAQGRSMVYEIYRHTAAAYGFADVASAAAAQERSLP